MTALRVLVPGDEEMVREFLAPRVESSMALASNLARAGFVDAGLPYQATWAGAFESGRLVGVAAHAWNGIVLVQSPADAGPLARFAVDATGPRRVSGLMGPAAQVTEARAALGLASTAPSFDGTEDLFGLDLASLRVPAALTDGRVRCRRTTDADLELCAAFRLEYEIESFALERSDDVVRAAREGSERVHARGDSFVLEDPSGAVVSYSAFNSRLPEIAQVGGVFTPPHLRARGYARAVVAGSLEIVAQEGTERSVLFTTRSNVAARRAYESIGFVVTGDFGLVLFPR